MVKPWTVWAGVLFMAMVFPTCRAPHSETIEVENSAPKYGGGPLVALEKACSIDVTRISLFGRETAPAWSEIIRFDKNDFIYILDRFDCTITVFDRRGEWVRTMAGPGQGPKELLRPSALMVHRKRMHVFQGFTEYKILSLDGEYVSSGLFNIENPMKHEAVDKSFYIFRGKTDSTISRLTFILSVFDEELFNGRDLFQSNYAPGLRGPNYEFCWPAWLHISENGEFYFPEDNLTRYSIVKYSRDGDPKIIFGREYEIEKYSRDAEERFYSSYAEAVEKGVMAFPNSPPVVRKMFQDQKNNLWVISGETYEDNRNPEFENSIDIFSADGEWLSSFESRSISRFCVAHRGKIYRIRPIDPDTFAQFIDVYEIKYLN